MNLPSLDKYENATVSGGKIFIDSTLIERQVTRTDVSAYYVPATRLALELGIPTLANMIMLGKMIKETGVVTFNAAAEAMKKVVSAKHANLLEANVKALKTGYDYQD